MAQSGQGRQRPKIFLPLNWIRKKSLFLQPKSKTGVGRIRFLVRQNWDFHPTPCVTHVRVWTSHLQYHPYLLDCCQSKYRDLASLLLLLSIVGVIHTCLIVTGARSWIGRLCFFFSSTTGAIHTCSIVAGARLRIYRSRVPLFLQLASNIGLSKPFYVHCTLYLSNKKTILFHFVYPFFFAITVL